MVDTSQFVCSWMIPPKKTIELLTVMLGADADPICWKKEGMINIGFWDL